MDKINNIPLDYFCFSSDCRGTNYKDLGEAQICLKEHAEYLLSSLDIERRAKRLQDKRMQNDQKILKNEISGVQLILEQIQEYVDQVYFVQNIPQLLKNNVIKVSNQFHNNFHFIYDPQYRQLQFTSQIKLLDDIVSRFQDIELKIKETYQKINIIKDESIRDIDILDFNIEEFNILGNISQENLHKQVQTKNKKKSKVNQRQSGIIDQNEKDTQMKIKKGIVKSKINKNSEKITIKSVKQQAINLHQMKILTEEKRLIAQQQKYQQLLLQNQSQQPQSPSPKQQCQQQQQQKYQQQQQIQKQQQQLLNDKVEINLEEDEIILEKNDKLDQKLNQNNIMNGNNYIAIEEEDDEEEEQIVQYIPSNQQIKPAIQQPKPITLYQNNLLQLNADKELEQTSEQSKNVKLLKKLKDEQKMNRQILFISENEQEFNIFSFSAYDQEVQILKGKSEGFKSKNFCKVDNEYSPETIFKNVKKSQIQFFDKALYAINLQSDGYLYLYNITHYKKQEIYFKSETTINDFYTYIDQQEGCIYIFTFKQSLYKILKFSINLNLKNQNRIKQIHAKNLSDSNILDMDFVCYEQKQKVRQMSILIQSQKSLFVQGTDFKDFSDETGIPYQGYIYFMKLIRHENINLYAVVGIDYTISIYEFNKYQLIKKINLDKKYEAPIDLIQISDELILIVQKQGIFLCNLNSNEQHIINQKCFVLLSDIESLYIKDINAYVLFKIESCSQVKKYNLQDIKKCFQHNSYSEQEQNQLQF